MFNGIQVVISSLFMTSIKFYEAFIVLEKKTSNLPIVSFSPYVNALKRSTEAIINKFLLLFS